MPRRRIGRIGAEIKLDVLAGRKRLVARAGQHQNLGFRIDRQFVEHLVHFEVDLRTHGIALIGPVDHEPTYAAFVLDVDRFVFLARRHGFLPLWIAAH